MSTVPVQSLLHKDRYQVFLLTSPATPWIFARHPWFIVNRKGVISRWEVVGLPRKHSFRWGHIYRDILPPYVGIGMFLPLYPPFWKGEITGFLEGGAESDAARMAEYIERSGETYPHLQRYVLTGPNSNTYAQWVLDAFPESAMRLPWNAVGKGYRKS